MLSDYVGIPFVDGGRDRSGADCYGIAVLVYDDLLRIPLPSYSGAYVTATDRQACASLIDRGKSIWREITPGFEKAFDAVLMTEGGIVRHIGIVAYPGYVLHTMPGRDSVIEPYRFGPLRLKIAGFYRHEAMLL